MKPTPYTPVRHLNVGALDLAYVRYHYGSVQFGHARDAMVAAGVSHTDAQHLLGAAHLPSKAFVLPRRTR